MVPLRQEGRMLKPQEWRSVDATLRDARLMVSRAANHLGEIYRCLLPSSDPRLWTPAQKTTISLFKRHFQSEKAVDALQVNEAYRPILSTLNRLQQNSFRVVGNAVARQEGQGDKYAYVRARHPLIYLAESFLAESSPVTSPAAPRSIPEAYRALCKRHGC